MAGHPRWAVPIHRMTIRERLAFGRRERVHVVAGGARIGVDRRSGDVESAGHALGFVAAHRRRLGVVPVAYLTSITARRRRRSPPGSGRRRFDELWDEGAALDPAVVRGWFTD